MHSQIKYPINHGVFLIFFYLIILSNIFQIINTISIKINSIPHQSLLFNKSSNKNMRKTSEQYIYGSSFKLNYYYSNLYLGEKMEKQGYILDTGSTITTGTCEPLCKHCGVHISPHYNGENLSKKILLCNDTLCKQVSSNCLYIPNNTKQCSFVISYSEGSSLSGVYINEQVRFGFDYKNQTPHNIPIGCTTDENHLFYSQDANGIMGLANNERNFVEILYKNGAIENNIFSLCFSQLGGLFNIGEINNKTHLENITYVPMLLDRGKYFGVNILSMSVNNNTIRNYEQYSYNIFIDSGTTICYINDKIFDEILTLMNKECSKYTKDPNVNPCGSYKYHSDYGHCFYFKTTEELDYSVNNYWPTIHFFLNDYDYKWKPQYYVFNISTEKNPGACMGMNKYSGTKITLGSSWIIGHDIIFDRKKKLLGMAEANCSVNEGINKSNGLELVENDHKLNINNSSNITNITNIINNKTGENISNYNNNNNKSSYDKEINISSKNISDKYDKIIFWQYIILAIFSFIFFIIIIIILYFKYFKKNDMKKMNIANENNINNNIIIKDNKKKDSSYEKIATEVDTKEIKDNKDNQSVIVIES